MLISFHYAKGVNLATEVGKSFSTMPRVFGDSGAFSAASVGASIDMGEYVEWITENRGCLAAYANLDVIGDPDASARNLKRMEALGLRPLPVFHTGTDFDVLAGLCQDYPYIALGGAVGFSTEALMPWLIQCFKIARGTGAVFHGFGLTNQAAIASFPWYSVDSSSWAAGYRWGRLNLFDPRTGKFALALLADRRSVVRHADLIRLHGGDVDALLDKDKYHSSFAAALGARSWRALETHIRRRHGPVRLSGCDPGLHLYQAGVLNDFTSIRAERINEALESEPGPHIYLADSKLRNHAVANAALSQSQG